MLLAPSWTLSSTLASVASATMLLAMLPCLRSASQIPLSVLTGGATKHCFQEPMASATMLLAMLLCLRSASKDPNQPADRRSNRALPTARPPGLQHSPLHSRRAFRRKVSTGLYPMDVVSQSMTQGRRVLKHKH